MLFVLLPFRQFCHVFVAYCCFRFRSFAFSFALFVAVCLSSPALKAVRLLMRHWAGWLAGWSSACAILKDAPKTGSKVSTFVMVQACQNVLATPPPPLFPFPWARSAKSFCVTWYTILTYRTIKKIYEPNEVVRKCVCLQQINSKSNLFGRF